MRKLSKTQQTMLHYLNQSGHIELGNLPKYHKNYQNRTAQRLINLGYAGVFANGNMHISLLGRIYYAEHVAPPFMAWHRDADTVFYNALGRRLISIHGIISLWDMWQDGMLPHEAASIYADELGLTGWQMTVHHSIG